MDVILVKDGRVAQVWRNQNVESIASERDWRALGDLYEAAANTAVSGMLYDKGKLELPPPPAAEPSLTTTQKLAKIGITVAELKAVLAEADFSVGFEMQRPRPVL